MFLQIFENGEAFVAALTFEHYCHTLLHNIIALTFERGFESFTEGNGCANCFQITRERATNSPSFVKKLHVSFSRGFVSHFHPSLQAPAPNVPRDSSLEKGAIHY